jgi:diphosphomevalonate decarboxylase
MMHAVMMTSTPPLQYWEPQTIEIMATVRRLRTSGTAVCYTVDAGPNVHCLCTADAEPAVRDGLHEEFPELQILRGVPGAGAQLVGSDAAPENTQVI